MTATIPVVNYLRLSGHGPPTLVATVCDGCGARFLGDRLACARCGQRTFGEVALAPTGCIGSFTIVHRAAAGVETPYVSALIDLDDGMTVKSKIVDCDPDPSVVTLGMRVRLTTFVAGTDDEGTEAVAFAFAPTRQEEP